MNHTMMLAPAAMAGAVTMTSLELVDFINEDRKARAGAVGAAFPSTGFAKLEHRDFLAKVPTVLGQGVCEKFRTPYRHPQNGQMYTMYAFPKREAILMAMSYSYELQAKVYDHMTALEQPALPNFADPVAAARAWADQFERREQLALENQAQAEALALAAPKVEFVDRYVAAGTGSMGVREVAKLLGAKQNEFTDFLLTRYMYRATPRGPLTPRMEHIHNGRFEVKTGVAEHATRSHTYVQYKFTPKGVNWVAGEWGKHKAWLAQGAEVHHA